VWQAEPVQAWVVVMVVVVAVALVLTVYGALHDRRLNRRRAAEMLGPPKREIPNLPAEARSPAYVTEAQARRRPSAPSPSEPVDSLREQGDGLGDQGVEVEIGVGYASADFVTDEATGEVVLRNPLVLVCADDVETVRELLPALEQALRTGQPLVVVAPTIAKDVLGTLEVNAIQGKVPGVAVLADDAVRAEVVAASGSEPVTRTDLRSGWMSPEAFGHLDRWTSTAKRSRLVRATARAHPSE
jgi:hypothetical protein